jgi:hypothetical protein
MSRDTMRISILLAKMRKLFIPVQVEREGGRTITQEKPFRGFGVRQTEALASTLLVEACVILGEVLKLLKP